MTRGIAVLIPVLERPHRVKPLVQNLRAVSVGIECIPIFILSEHDEAEAEEVEKYADAYSLLILPGPLSPGDYARKINHGFDNTDETFVFLGADDLIFHEGWAERAVAAWYDTGACVIGTNDLANPMVQAGRHATHCLVHRAYGECGTIDDEDRGKLLHEGYFHLFVDNEFVETAQARRTYWHARDVHVEHRHPIWKSAPNDLTYDRGSSQHAKDGLLFRERQRLWQ